MTLGHWCAALSLVMVVSCGRHDQSGASNPRPETVSSGRDLPVVQLAVWPELWPQVLEAVPEIKDAVRGAGDPKSFWTVAQAILSEFRLQGLALPPPGLDPSAPIELAVFPPARGFEAIAVVAVEHKPAAPADTAVRIRITLPARDPAALAGALEGPLGKHPEFAIARGKDAVAVDIYVMGGAAPHDAPAPVRAVPFETGEPSAARFVLRAGGLAEVAASAGMVRTAQALGDASPDDAALLLDAGMKEVLTGYLLADPATSIADAMVVEIPANGHAPRVVFAASRTGVAALTAAGLKPGTATPISTIDWHAAVAAVPVSPLVGDENKTARVFHECGWSCFVYLALGNALQMGDVMREQILAQAGAITGSSPDALVVRWDAGDMITLRRAGVATAALARPPIPPPPSAAAQCYRKALLDVRGALQAAEDQPAALAEAIRALDGATSCLGGDATFTDRQHALRDAITKLQAKLPAAAAAHRP